LRENQKKMLKVVKINLRKKIRKVMELIKVLQRIKTTKEKAMGNQQI